MGAVDGRTWLEHLSPAECWRLLASTPVGRIGVLNDSAPEIYPVNHIVDRETIVFRTDAGDKLRGLTRSPAVCYEVDGIVPGDATGWSVLVKGRAVEVDDPDEVRVCRSTPAAALGRGAQAPLGPDPARRGHRPAHLEQDAGAGRPRRRGHRGGAGWRSPPSTVNHSTTTATRRHPPQDQPVP